VIYATLFRGLNVGGKNTVKMADLESFLFDLGLKDIKTYIQSGNAVFRTDLNEQELLHIIMPGFYDRFGFESNVVIRNLDEMRHLIEQLPIPTAVIEEAEKADPMVEHLYVYFLDRPPTQQQTDTIGKAYLGTDILRLGQREAYLLCRQSVRQSQLAARASKIFDTATVRNWKTVNRLYDMMR